MGKAGMAGHTHALPDPCRQAVQSLSPAASQPVNCVDIRPSLSASKANPALPTSMTMWMRTENLHCR